MVNKNKQFVLFADKNFEKYCVENFDFDGDGRISAEEALLVTEMDCNSKDIVSLKGIEYFKNLNKLDCDWNPLERLEIPASIKISELICDSCHVTQSFLQQWRNMVVYSLAWDSLTITVYIEGQLAYTMFLDPDNELYALKKMKYPEYCLKINPKYYEQEGYINTDEFFRNYKNI